MKIISVNGGNGVISFSMKKHLVGNIEIRSIFHTKFMEQWKINFGDIPYFRESEDLTRMVKPDVIIGAPNCGHSSVLTYSRAKKLSDPLKDESFELYLISIMHFKPKVFLMENLPKVLKMVPLEVLEKTFPDYELIVHTKSVSEWGNSQINRVRLVLIGLHKDSFGDNLEKAQYHMNNIYKINILKTSGQLLKGLENKGLKEGNVREDLEDIITLYAGYKTSLENIRDFWLNNPTIKRYPVTYRKFTTAPGVYINRFDDYPATARKANRQFNHQGLQLSPRELARIQGVPDRFKIFIDPYKKYYWINKGRATITKTPPYEIGKWFYKQLKQIHKLWK